VPDTDKAREVKETKRGTVDESIAALEVVADSERQRGACQGLSAHILAARAAAVSPALGDSGELPDLKSVLLLETDYRRAAPKALARNAEAQQVLQNLSRSEHELVGRARTATVSSVVAYLTEVRASCIMECSSPLA